MLGMPTPMTSARSQGSAPAPTMDLLQRLKREARQAADEAGTEGDGDDDGYFDVHSVVRGVSARWNECVGVAERLVEAVQMRSSEMQAAEMERAEAAEGEAEETRRELEVALQEREQAVQEKEEAEHER